MQKENETTPACSEADINDVPDAPKASPSKKKKVIKKRDQLEPKKLPFQDKKGMKECRLSQYI